MYRLEWPSIPMSWPSSGHNLQDHVSMVNLNQEYLEKIKIAIMSMKQEQWKMVNSSLSDNHEQEKQDFIDMCEVGSVRSLQGAYWGERRSRFQRKGLMSMHSWFKAHLVDDNVPPSSIETYITSSNFDIKILKAPRFSTLECFLLSTW